MLIVIAEAEVPEGSRAALLEAGAAMVTASRQEAGCVGYDYAWDILDPNVMRIRELWKDEAALRFHFKTPHMAAFLGALRAEKTVKTTIVVYDGGNPHEIGKYAVP
jgi:quinol monooxygenase YgiN